MKALKASIKSLKDQISILTETLKNSGSKENFDTLFQAIAKISASSASQQLSIKKKIIQNNGLRKIYIPQCLFKYF